MTTVTITHSTRKIGYGINTSPDRNGYFETPNRPDFEGTIKQVFNYIDTDPTIRSLRSGGTIFSTAFFVNGQRIQTNSEAWQYELDRLIEGEIDSLELPIEE